MADTFTAALKARKIEQGGYDPAWASRLNDDVLEIFDAALEGRKTISIGSSTTPSLAALVSGTLSDSHYWWLVFTGTPASAVTLTVPASVTTKEYLIDNQTGQAMTVKYSATAGVTVQTGDKLRVLCDGTTVIESPALPRFKRTAAEILAAVTPTDYSYVPGDLRRYGAALNGTTDDSTAWSRADSQAAQGGAPIFVPRTTGGMGTASALTVDYRSDVCFEPGAFIKYTGSSNIVVLTIGDASNIAFTRRYERLWVTRTNLSDWTSESSVGIRFRNVTGCYISIAESSRHTIGVQTLPAGGNGFQYNEVHLGQIYNNKFGLDLSNVTSGYTNENNWHGGRFTVLTGVNTSTARYGVRVTSSDSSYLTNNNNHFWKPSIELNASDASAEAIPVLMTRGVNNHFHGVRDEGNDTPFCREANDSTENMYEIGFSTYAGPPTIETANSPNYVSLSSRFRALDFARKVFDSGPMHKNWNNYDGAGGAVFIPNVHLGFSGSGSTVFTATTGVTTNASYLDVTGGGPGVFVNTDEVKQFVVSRQCESGRGGRVIVVCYDTIDGGGSIISTAGSVKGSSAAAFSTTSGYGNGFTTGSDANDDVVFTVTSSVKSVRVLIVAGTATVRIRQFSIWSVNTQRTPGTYVGYAQIGAPGEGMATATPTTGTYPQGKRLWSPSVAAAGSPGLICTTGGTPGTWKAMANVAA